MPHTNATIVVNLTKFLTTRPLCLNFLSEERQWNQKCKKKNAISNVKNWKFQRICIFSTSIRQIITYSEITEGKWLISVKKQNLKLSKLYSNYKELPETNLDETDVDCSFGHNISKRIQIWDQLTWVSRCFNKNSLGISLFQL